MLKKKRNVLLVVRWPVGGIRTFIRYVYRKFDPERWRFTILAPNIAEMRVLIDDLSDLDVRYVPVEENPSTISFALKVTGELMCGRYDVVHSHGFISGMCAALSAKLSRTAHLMTSHDVINENQFVGTKGKLKKLVMGSLLDLIDIIHSVSHDAENNLLLYFPALARRKGRCIVIYNGIEVERFQDGVPRDLRGELGMNKKVFLIGFFGRFMSQKGFRYLVDAIELLRQDTRLFKRPVVLTFGDGGFVREEKQALLKKGLDGYFRFLPFTPNVACTIKGLDLIVIPSLWEACPILPMEILACGTPLIASNCIGLREIVKDTPTYIVSPKSSLELAEGIKSLMMEGNFKVFQSCPPLINCLTYCSC